MSLPVGSPVLTYCSGCNMDLLAVGDFPQMGCNVNNSELEQLCGNELCNRLYADGHVHHWCGSEDPSTVQLLIDTTTVLQ